MLLPLLSCLLLSAAHAAGAGPAVHDVAADDDGQFYVTALVNGAPVRFVVDTGASIVILRPQDAARAGLRLRPADYSLEADSAAGPIALAPVTIDRLAVGPNITRRVEAAVGDPSMDVSLLGMSYLSRAGRIIIHDGRLTIGG